jgi:opacity protein-like surface antigen
VAGLESDIQLVNLNHSKDNFFSGPGYAGFPGAALTITASAAAPGLVGTPPVALFGSSANQLGPNTFTFFDPRAPFADNRAGPEWYGTIRGKVGYAWNRFLVYGTGGFAYGEGGKNVANFVIPTHVGPFPVYNQNCAAIGFCESSTLRTGWVAGGGFEYAFWNNFSVKLEAMYVRLNRNNNDGWNGTFLFNSALPYAVASGPGFPGSPYTIFYAPANAFSPRPVSNRNNDSFIVVRAGIDYKFDFAAPAPAPVVARY